MWMLPGSVYATTWQVGPTREIRLPSEAAKLANDDDSIEFDAGIYPGDVTSWPQHRLTLRGINGRAHLEAQGKSAEDKAIWVIKGNNVNIENIEFSGATAPALNGAGIRFEGTNLTIRNSHFHHNQMGLLTGTNPLSEISIAGSEFNDNTVDYRRYGKLGHNIYIGNIRRFNLRNCYVHDANTGHNVKSRARENHLLYNRISDESNASSYLVDLPDGGDAYMIGNLLHQSIKSENQAMVAFAAEHHQTDQNQALYMVNNTLVNDRPDGVFLHNHSIVPATLINNLLVGQSTVITGSNIRRHNILATDEKFVSRENLDYRLLSGAVSIDQGIDPGDSASGAFLRPEFQYRHNSAIETRRQIGNIDVGAYEFSDTK